MLATTIDLLALLSVGALWGGMAFFAAVYAPLVFIKLEAEAAGRFIRQVFPVYYLAMGIMSGIAALALALSDRHGVTAAFAMACVCAAFWLARQALMPRINRSRDAHLAGDDSAGRRFKRLHRASVIVNGVQLLVVLVVLARFAWV